MCSRISLNSRSTSCRLRRTWSVISAFTSVICIEIQLRFVSSKHWFQVQNQATNSHSFVCFLPCCIFPTPNTQLTTIDSGHSDQQDAKSGLNEEDGMDESALLFLPRCPSLIRVHLVLITSDEKNIVDKVRLDLNPCLLCAFIDIFSGSQSHPCESSSSWVQSPSG